METILIIILNAGKRENRKTASACVAMTNSAEVKFNAQKPQSIGICITPKKT